jgi:WD40 repeat protein
MAERDRCRTRLRRHAVTTGLLALSMAALATVGTARSAAARTEAALSSSSGVTAVAFSPDGTVLASGYADGAVRLWDVATGQLHGPVLLAGSGGAGAVNAVAFSPAGTLLAGGYGDGMVRLWNPATGQPSGSSLQAGSAVNAVAFSRDGTLASGGADGVVLLWGPVAGQPAGRGIQYWIILVAAVIALALAALAAVITTRDTWPAGQR